MKRIEKQIPKVPTLTPSQFDEYLFLDWKPKVSGFYDRFHIERIENYKKHLNIPLAPHRRSVYFFIYITKGVAVRSKGLTAYEISQKNFFFLPAHQITSLDFVAENTEGFYCHFKPEIFPQSLLKLEVGVDFPFFHLTSHPVIEMVEDENILQVLQILEKEYRKNVNERFELIPIYLAALFTEVKKCLQTTPRNSKNAAAFITQRYKDALAEQIYELKNVADYASLLSISPNHLHKCVKATTGKSAHELLQEMRILESKVLLQQSTLTVGEIALMIGKSSVSDFCRFFKIHTSMTPIQYRQKLD